MMELRCYYSQTGQADGNVVDYGYPAWRYDDAEHGRVGEPFVMGASEMIDILRMLDGLPEERDPFTLVFSTEEFEDAHKVEHVSKDDVGDWYQWKGNMFWLCPALLDFFESAPKTIYVKAKP